jgi:hypothetical protein
MGSSEDAAHPVVFLSFRFSISQMMAAGEAYVSVRV